jgi:hypothetical protein
LNGLTEAQEEAVLDYCRQFYFASI